MLTEPDQKKNKHDSSIYQAIEFAVSCAAFGQVPGAIRFTVAETYILVPVSSVFFQRFYFFIFLQQQRRLCSATFPLIFQGSTCLRGLGVDEQMFLGGFRLSTQAREQEIGFCTCFAVSEVS